MRKPIADFCKDEVLGWTRVDTLWGKMYPFPEEEKKYFRSYLRDVDRLQIILSVKEYFGNVELYSVHVSLGGSTFDSEKVLSEAGQILSDFFGDLVFARMPDDPRNPHLKHFFHLIDSPLVPFHRN